VAALPLSIFTGLIRSQPHIDFFKHLLQHAIKFSRSLLLASLFKPFACIGLTFTSASGKDLVHSLRQLGQNYLSGILNPSTLRLS
jgi:hypothetical protein